MEYNIQFNNLPKDEMIHIKKKKKKTRHTYKYNKSYNKSKHKDKTNANKENTFKPNKCTREHFESAGENQFIQKQSHNASHLKLIDEKLTCKTNDTMKFLKQCLLKEILFQGMDKKILNEIIDVMYRIYCPFGKCIIIQNEYIDAYFVIQSGAFDIIHQVSAGAGEQENIIGEMLPGQTFGGSSLLYSIPRQTTLVATKSSVVWALDATKFNEIREKISQQMNNPTSKIVRYLQKIELFERFHHENLINLAQAVTQRTYAPHTHIIQQGHEICEFFIVKSGTCIAVMETDNGKDKTLQMYLQGDFFSEYGVYKHEKHTANVIATSTITCYVIKASDFTQLSESSDNYNNGPFQNLIECELESFVQLGILGVGTFGSVSLVKDPTTSITYALKKINKNKIIFLGQQQHVRNEKNVLAIIDSDFCVKLYGTYQNEFCIYFLMEPVLGGELFTLLRWNKRFSESTTRFYAACVILAFEHLHCANIIFRDLKPENVLISSNGYCKLVDFGFANKTNNCYTLCGTPQYMSPELIENNLQTVGIDWWALGIFIYEMVIGNVPFEDDSYGKMYEKIISDNIKFPLQPKLNTKIKHLICGLLEKNSLKRLGRNGTKQILNHPWFYGFNWNKMRQQKITPPYVPNIDSQEDMSHYDIDRDMYTDENVVEKLDAHPSDYDYDWCKYI